MSSGGLSTWTGAELSQSPVAKEGAATRGASAGSLPAACAPSPALNPPLAGCDPKRFSICYFEEHSLSSPGAETGLTLWDGMLRGAPNLGLSEPTGSCLNVISGVLAMAGEAFAC